jgi:thioredoxin 1
MLGPILEELESEIADKCKVVKVNVDEERSVAQQYGIMSIPTVMLFKNGEVVGTMIGVQPKESYLEAIESNA